MLEIHMGVPPCHDAGAHHEVLPNSHTPIIGCPLLSYGLELQMQLLLDHASQLEESVVKIIAGIHQILGNGQNNLSVFGFHVGGSHDRFS